jgi:hypothetical protein
LVSICSTEEDSSDPDPASTLGTPDAYETWLQNPATTCCIEVDDWGARMNLSQRHMGYIGLPHTRWSVSRNEHEAIRCELSHTAPNGVFANIVLRVPVLDVSVPSPNNTNAVSTAPAAGRRIIDTYITYTPQPGLLCGLEFGSLIGGSGWGSLIPNVGLQWDGRGSLIPKWDVDGSTSVVTMQTASASSGNIWDRKLLLSSYIASEQPGLELGGVCEWHPGELWPASACVGATYQFPTRSGTSVSGSANIISGNWAITLKAQFSALAVSLGWTGCGLPATSKEAAGFFMGLDILDFE